MVINDDFKFIDLFAGIGGFHCAMKNYSRQAECVFACEINKKAQKIYELNFGLTPFGDIKEVDPEIIEDYDVLCAGFPCQTFSKAGFQEGLKDPRGTLFQEIIRIAAFNENVEKRPKIMILENVRNLITHDHGDTWRTIKNALNNIGYNVIETPIVIGPKDLGIPQLRDRAIIVAVREDIYDGPIEIHTERRNNNTTSVFTILEKELTPEDAEKTKLSDSELYILDCWDEFIHNIDEKVIGYPIWSDEFGLDYDVSIYPKWKQEFINKNRELYRKNRQFIDDWLIKWDIRNKVNATFRKFEWQCGTDYSSVYDGIIQFRTSGIRVKRPTETPTLVAMNHNPIIGKLKRYITVKEAARLQSFPEDFKFDESDNEAYFQLGNAVNVKVIEYVFRQFIAFLEDIKNGKC